MDSNKKNVNDIALAIPVFSSRTAVVGHELDFFDLIQKMPLAKI